MTKALILMMVCALVSLFDLFFIIFESLGYFEVADPNVTFHGILILLVGLAGTVFFATIANALEEYENQRVLREMLDED